MTAKEPRVVYVLPRKLIIAWAVSFIIMLALTGAAMQYANIVDERSNKSWCELITSLDEQYRQLPADASERSKQFARRIHDLSFKLGCKDS